MEDKYGDAYSTTDISVSALLYSSGKRLIKLNRDGSRCYFIFKDKVACQELADAFWRKESLVDAKTFADSLRSLKDLIFSR